MKKLVYSVMLIGAVLISSGGSVTAAVNTLPGTAVNNSVLDNEDPPKPKKKKPVKKKAFGKKKKKVGAKKKAYAKKFAAKTYAVN